nr:SCP extracellular domain containing protein [Haemonchus contortus]
MLRLGAMLVFLLQLPAGGSSPDYDDPIPITYEDFTLRTTEYINSVRQVVANGQVVESKWGSVNPPTSKHMFRLKWSPEMETYAGINVQGCQSSNSIPSGGSLSFNTIQLSGDTASDSLSTTNKFSRVMPQDFNYTKGTLTLFNEVLWNWTDPLYYNLTDGQGQVIYNDKTMEPFANMMYYKATEVGCAVQICNNIFATACVFNKAYQTTQGEYGTMASRSWLRTIQVQLRVKQKSCHGPVNSSKVHDNFEVSGLCGIMEVVVRSGAVVAEGTQKEHIL